MTDPATNTTYEIEVVHVDRDDWLDELRKAVAAELLDLGLHRSVTVNVVDSPADPNVPAVVAVFGSPAATTSSVVEQQIETAMGAGLVVLPVVEELGRFNEDCPAAVRHLNGLKFSAERLARVLLQELGIEDRELRVFISHKRDDGLWAAEQMHDELAHRAFRPFIDRFAVRPAGNVQVEIANALEDHAFLLLMESPLAHTGPWVYDEVDYAVVHTMAMLIVSWPGALPVPGSAGLPRLHLSPDEIEQNAHGADELTDAAIDRVLAAVEAAHARGLVRRRRQIICSIEDAARARGAAATPLPNWRLLVQDGATQTIVGIAPRLPTAADLQHLDAARTNLDGKANALLIHAARILPPDRAEHLRWAAGDRKLEIAPENAVGRGWA